MSQAIPYPELAKMQKPDAVTLLRRAVELNPDEATSYYLLGQRVESCGRGAEAKRALKRVRELKAAELEI